VLSPLLHAIYRLEEGGRDQIRASLTRSYRAPTLQNIAARPSINSRFPAAGANTASSPDRAGNPDIRPELATGLDLAFERYLDGGGVLSASVFHRRIQDLIRNQTALETVSWSGVPRYVSRPQNVGKATTEGIELEAKFRLDEAVANAAPIDLRTNGAVFRSRVDGIAGPDNRLDQQPGWTAGLGADYRLRALPLTLGGNLALTPAYAVQQSATQRSTTDARRVLDAYALWRFSAVAQLRLSASNLLPRDETSTTTVTTTDAGQILQSSTTTFEPSQTSWSLRLELKL
jgi:iron complex outermembrane receptor protein